MGSGTANNHVTKEKLVSDLKTIVRDAEELLKATANDLSQKANTAASSARQKVEESVRDAKHRLASAEESLRDQTKEAVENADVYVRDNPWTAVGVAAGVGLILGVLLSRK